MMKMSEKLLLSLMALIIFVFSFFLFPIRYGLGCENNLETCESDEITRQYMREYDEEAIREQQELLDFYERQKNLADENKFLREELEQQKIEFEKKELLDENKALREIIEKQRLELEKKQLEDEKKVLQDKVEEQKLELIKKEDQIKIKESAHLPVSSPSQIPQQSTSKSLEEAAKQVAKETNRVVKKTDREVKRIFKKF